QAQKAIKKQKYSTRQTSKARACAFHELVISAKDSYLHSNGIYVIGIAPSNIILQCVSSGNTITKINFDIGNAARDKSRVHGKHKRGALTVEPSTVICEVNMSNGVIFPVFAGCNGFLLESNMRFAEQPTLLAEKPSTDGFIAIIDPKPDFLRQARFLSEIEYLQHINEHRETINNQGSSLSNLPKKGDEQTPLVDRLMEEACPKHIDFVAAQPFEYELKYAERQG
ncbi:MAG: hypothetical protein EZS28_042652, partial [Streblomastix strix]